MQIQLNATLVVQMIHFGIAYCIIRQFFLKPAVAARVLDETQENAVIELQMQKQQQIEQAHYMQKQAWDACQSYYVTHKPALIPRTMFRNLTHDAEPVTVIPEEYNRAVALVVSRIKEAMKERL
jgi:hypothetical protein